MRIPYELVRSARKTLAIQIRQDGLVQVRAPLRLPMRDIEAFLHARQDWIRHHLDEIAARPPAATLPDWGEGRGWWHLGQWLDVREALQEEPPESATLTVPGAARRRSPRLWHDAVTSALVVTPALWNQPERLQAALQRWQGEQAAALLPARLQHHVHRLGWGWQPAGLRLRSMRSRWGSCSRDGMITLNTQLMSVPAACIDYVICHELCHLREFNHGPAFKRWQDQVFPDWQSCQREMKDWAERLRVQLR